MHFCDVCNSAFPTKQAAAQHKKRTKHCVCRHCDKALASLHGLQAHTDALHRHECPQCPAVLAEKRLLTNHQKSRRHCYCGDCNKAFGTVQGFQAHLQSSRHSTEFRCCDCDRDFNSAGALDQHLRDKVHQRRPSSTPARRKSASNDAFDLVAASGLQCTECTREFATEHALAQHLSSLIHKPLGEFACFAGSSCGATFSSPSAVLHHLESGACPSGVDRAQMRALIMKHDVDRLVTRPPAEYDHQMSIEAGWNQDSLLVHELSNLSVSPVASSHLTPVSGGLTPASGSSLSDWSSALIAQTPTHRCPFCPPERRPFGDATALRQHLESAAHSEPFIYCPVSLSGSKHGLSGAMRQFTTVAGLAQHLESGACVGGVDSFWEAVKYLETRFREMGLQVRLVQDGKV